MLRPSCRRFRAEFEIGLSASHRGRCAACAAWAASLEGAADSIVRRPLPAALADRLRQIPRRAARCVQQQRLYRAARAAARGELPTAEVVDHLEHCGRCRDLYDTLVTALVPRRFRLPESLAQRLSALARRPPRTQTPDLWQGLAACCLLTLGLMAAAPELAEPLGTQARQARTQAVGWVASGSDVGHRTWRSFSGGIGAAYVYTSSHLAQISHLGGRVVEVSGAVPAARELWQKIDQTLNKNSEGDEHERARRDPERDGA